MTDFTEGLQVVSWFIVVWSIVGLLVLWWITNWEDRPPKH